MDWKKEKQNLWVGEKGFNDGETIGLETIRKLAEINARNRRMIERLADVEDFLEILIESDADQDYIKGFKAAINYVKGA